MSPLLPFALACVPPVSCCALCALCCASSLRSAHAVSAAISRRWNVCPGGAGPPSFFIADIIFYCQIKIPGSAGFIAATCAALPILAGSFPLTARGTLLFLRLAWGGKGLRGPLTLSFQDECPHLYSYGNSSIRSGTPVTPSHPQNQSVYNVLSPNLARIVKQWVCA